MVTKWYVPEAKSRAALELRNRFTPPSVLTHVHRIELQNAWQLKVYRKEMPAEAAARAADDLQSDIDAGVWLPPQYDLDAVFGVSVRLAREHTAVLGTRSLDLLHVAAALALHERHFVTGDDRQARLAAAAGLKVTRL
ncbi:MAG TPA: PIN domain nuclease [Candidatus Methylomirabilis sp.]|nr:PIN domain nuclease [Candidatus Methylomirabilis sp.]